MIGGVVEPADVNAIGRADACAQLAADALLHPVLVAVEYVAAVLTRLLGLLLLGIHRRDPGPGQVLEGQFEAAQEGKLVLHLVAHAHYASPPCVGSAGTGVSRGRGGRLTRRPMEGITASSSLRPAPRWLARSNTTVASSTTGTRIRPPQPQAMIAATSSNHPSVIGMSRFQPRSISWS